MDIDDTPGLSVGFTIDFNDSFGNLKSLDDILGETAANAVREFKRIETAAGGSIKLGGATADMKAFGNAATAELKKFATEQRNAERAGGQMVRQLERQIEVFGKTASEVRNLRAEQKALALDKVNLGADAAKLRELNAELNRLENALVPVGASGKLAGHHMQNLVFQFQDLGIQMFAAAQSSAPLKMGLMALAQQGTQISGIMSQAGIGIKGVGLAFAQMSKGILLATVTNPLLLGLATTIGVFAGAVSLLNDVANDGAPMEEYAKSLGLTADQIKELDNVTVTWGDTAKAVFQVAGAAIWDSIGPAVTSTWETMKDWVSWIFSGVKDAVNFLIGGFVGAYNLITKTWSAFPAVMADLFFSGVNAGIDAINGLIERAVAGVNGFIATANTVLAKAGMELPMLSAPQIAKVSNQYAGAAAKMANTVKSEMGKAMGVDYLGNFGSSIVDQARKNAEKRIRDQAAEKGFLDGKDKSGSDKATKADKHAEALQREADAVEAQIKNLYALADAYKISGAAALIAAAQVKAESEAIKKRGDIEVFVNRELRLNIAQRVSDAAKATAALREQADAQSAANEMVAKGLIPAEMASEWVKDQIADLPLLAALQVAQQRGLTTEVDKATDALKNQRAERNRLREVEEAAAFTRDIKSGQNRLAEIREELRLVGASNAERTIALAILKATQEAEAKFTDPARRAEYIKQQTDIAQATLDLAAAQKELNDALSFTADKWDLIALNVQNAAQGLAGAFGSVGAALGDLTAIYANFQADRARLDEQHQAALKEAGKNEKAVARLEQLYALQTANIQIGAYGDMTAAAKGFFNEKSKGYKALLAAEKVFRAFEFAMSVKSMVQDVAETVSSVANSAARATANGAEGVAAQAKLPFPANIAAMAATAAALVAAGIAVLGGSGGLGSAPKTNNGTGTVLGDAEAQSASIKNAIASLKEVDLLMLNTSRQMAASLRTIEDNISGFASLLVRNAGGINASGGVTEGFNANIVGDVLGKIPLIGGLLKGLFGTTTTVIGSGLFGGAQTLGSILDGGFDASYYSDIRKKKKFFGITTSNRVSTRFSDADGALETQFTLILRSFNDAILAAAGPLGASTDSIAARLNSFVLDIGRIDLQGLTGEEIEEKLNAVFGAAADDMARAAFPLIEQYQKVGEGAFETLVRVASTIEQVTASLGLLGRNATLGLDATLALADQFESLSAFAGAVDAYFTAFYTREEQAAARSAQMADVFVSLGLAMPTTLAGFRALVEAQDLTSAAGREAYAVLLQLAPAFADLQAAMSGAKSAADIATERADLQRQLLELQGDTAALRALQLAKLDASNRALQLQIWALQDAQAAARAADELRKAWQSVGDSIMDEVKRIRGLTDAGGGNSFAVLQGQFNSATTLARGGDQDAAKSLPGLSQALLAAAADAATSRQELDRIRAQTAASLEATYGAITALSGGTAGVSNTDLLDAVQASQSGTAAGNDNGPDAAAQSEAMRNELTQMRIELNSALATIAANTGSIKRTMDNVSSQSGGDAISMVVAA